MCPDQDGKGSRQGKYGRGLGPGRGANKDGCETPRTGPVNNPRTNVARRGEVRPLRNRR